MTKPTCVVDTCEREVRRVDWCNAHYLRKQRYGDPLALAPKRKVSDRFWAKVAKTEACWEWQGYVMPNGYGQFSPNRNHVLAHRYAYQLTHGEIPAGIEIDHICFNRACVNPSHLRAATHKQNGEHKRGAQSNNKSSGIRNVYWREDCQKWEVKVGHNRKSHHVGLFASIAEAEAAAIATRLTLFTHNHLDRTA